MSLEHAASLGRELRLLDAEGRVRELARVAANEREATSAWSTQDGNLVCTVTAGPHSWAVGTPQMPSESVAKDMVLLCLTVSLVHEVTGCQCTRTQGAICSAYRAFSREVDA